MAELTQQDVSEISQLAMLSLSADEAERIRVELSAILDAMAVLAAVDTTSVAPMTHAMPMDLRLRSDTIEPSLAVEVALAAAPSQSDDMFVVPLVIGGDS